MKWSARFSVTLGTLLSRAMQLVQPDGRGRFQKERAPGVEYCMIRCFAQLQLRCELGTAVLMPRDRIAEIRETADHYLLQATARSGVPVVHYVGAGWTDSGDFHAVEDWWRHLDRLSARLANPVAVTLVPAR